MSEQGRTVFPGKSIPEQGRTEYPSYLVALRRLWYSGRVTGTSGFYEHFREYLITEFEDRVARNPSYSMRAFARDLGIAVSTLNELLKGRYGLSRKRALDVAEKLGLSKDQCRHFADLFVMRNQRAGIERQLAARRVEKRIRNFSKDMSLDSFMAISAWYHMAILELTELGDFVSEPGWISKRLGLPEPVISEAIERLTRLGLLTCESGTLRAQESTTAVGGGDPSEAIRKFHGQIIEKARIAMERQDLSKREISSTVFSIRAQDLAEAKQELLRFRRSFARRFLNTAEKDDVYCLSMQFFSLLEEAK